jgi:hypothetical protein
VKNRVILWTNSPDAITKKRMALLSAGLWLGWKQIIAAVPELTSSLVEVDALRRWEWCRKWDVEREEIRLRADERVFS